MDSHRPPDARGRNQASSRSHVAAAVAARHTIAAALAVQTPAGRGNVGKTTQDARVLLAVIALTFGYSKRTEPFAMTQLSALAGYDPKACGRVMARLREHGWVEYTAANRLQGRMRCRVSLSAPDAEAGGGSWRPDGLDETQPLRHVTEQVRALISTVLLSNPTLAQARMTLALIARFPTWLALSGRVGRAELAADCGLDPKTTSRVLTSLAALGALTYVPGRGRGILGHVTIGVPAPAAESAATPRPRARATALPGLSPAERERLNNFLGHVLAHLAAISRDEAAAVQEALETMGSRTAVARMLNDLLEHGYHDEAGAALVAPLYPGQTPYQGAHSVPGSLHKRVRTIHAAHPDARGPRVMNAVPILDTLLGDSQFAGMGAAVR